MATSRRRSRPSRSAPTTSSKSRSSRIGCCWSWSAPSRRRACVARTRSCAFAPAATSTSSAPRPPTGSRILISGPAGAGKEVVARLLHTRSRRAGAPFVVLNCAIMRPERLEIELFGAEAGIESADSTRKVGTFEQAHGGTLFVDELADMPLETQGKTVRALQEQTFERVGGSRVEVDVRVIAATNRDLALEIAADRFREDLYYRLAVVPLRVPSLVERREDIPHLARHFMARSAEAARVSRREFGEDALAVLQAYEWPGNARQLRNVVDWMMIMAPGEARELLTAEMVPTEVG